MESYESFFLRSLADMRSEEDYEKTRLSTPGQLVAPSFISFYGRPVLPPLLSAGERRDMAEFRQRAVQRQAERMTLPRRNLLTDVQNILEYAQLRKVTEIPDPPFPPAGHAPKLQYLNGFTSAPVTSTFPGGVEEPVALNGKKEEGGAKHDGENSPSASLQNLLRKSREYLEKEQGRRGSRVGSRIVGATTPIESLSDKENESVSPGGSTDSDLLYPRQQQSASSPSHTPTPTHRRSITGADPHTYHDSFVLGGLSPSLPGSNASPQSPEPKLSPRPHRGRPRPVSAGNITFSFPVCSNEIARSKEVAAMAMHGALSPGVERRMLESVSPTSSLVLSTSSSRRASHSGSGPMDEVGSPIRTPGSGPIGHDISAAGFRRRCHTLDGHVGAPQHNAQIDRSQERIPRFMAGVPTQRLPCRRSPPASLTQPCSEEQLPGASPVTSPCPLQSDRLPTSTISTPTEEARKDEVQRRMQALEEMQKRLEEEHALQMALLIAEQEREHLRLQQELEERDKRQWEQSVKPVGGDGGDWRSMCEHYSTLNPSCLLSPAERSSGHSTPSKGVPSPVSPGVVSPSVQSPVYLWGSTWAAGKPRTRLSQVLSPGQQRALCRLGAIVRGFLTRRLLKTEKVKHLRQTVQDTQEFIRSFGGEAPQKKSSLSAQDLSLQDRVRAQLRAALFDVHDIFFVMPLEEQLALLEQDRELRSERKLREMEKARSPKDKVILSTATQKSLERKKHKVGESPGQTRRMQQKPRSPTNKILQPSQGQNALVSSQLLRQGSMHRKTPEERLKRTDSLRKQHSLG